MRETVRSLEEAESHLGDDRSKVVSWEGELQVLTPELEKLQALAARSTSALGEAEEAMHEWQHEWDVFNHQAAEPRQQAEVQQSRIQHLEQVLQRLQERSNQLADELRNLAAKP